MTKTAAAVIFQAIHPRAEIRIPLNEAAAFQQANAGSHRVVKIEWTTGDWSWGKCWWFSNSNVVQRFGAGAYGDMVVWEHPVNPYDRAARIAAGIDIQKKVAA